MSVESEINDRLTGFSGLAALIGSRVDADNRQQNDPLPAITFLRIDSRRVWAMGSDTGLVRARYQFDIWTDNYADIISVAEQLRLALQRWRTTTGTIVQETFIVDDRDISEPEDGFYHRAMDFEINYEE